jgi:MFS family permease
MGQAISMSGTWMQTIAQSWLVLKLTNSGTALGIATALQFMPILLFGLWGGVIADRFPKRTLLYLTQSTSGVLALILGILVATGTVRLWMVYVLALCLGLVNAVDNPTRQAFVFEMVGKDEVRNAVTLNSSQVSLSRVIGPAIAGALIATVGLAPCFIINGLSYIAVLISLFMMRADQLHTAPPVASRKGQLLEGFRYVTSTPELWNILIIVAIIGTLSYEFQVSLPLLAQFTFRSNAEGYAALTSAMGIGAVIGGVLTAGLKKMSQRATVNAALIFGASILFVAIMPNLTLAVAAMVIVGFFSIYFISLANSILQLESSQEMRGRVMSFWSIAFLGSTTIGGPIIGWVGENAGPRWGLAVGGFAAIFAAVLTAARWRMSASQTKKDHIA